MNDLYTQDRMARNAADYEGSGVGDGRYSEREERMEKISQIKLPLIIFAFMCIYWAIVIYFTATELVYVFEAEKYELPAEKGQWTVTVDIPEYGKKDIGIEESDIRNGVVTVYYHEGRQAIYKPQTWDTWLMFYGFGLIVTFLLFMWIKKILFAKKHAVAKEPRAHSYKDY